MGAPSRVIVTAIGVPRSAAVSVKGVLDTPESATERARCWYTGNGV